MRETLLAFRRGRGLSPITVPKKDVLATSLELALGLAPVLHQRRWSIVISPDRDFISGDTPVALIATGPGAPPFLGYRGSDTSILAPLNRQMTAVGTYDGETRIAFASTAMVEIINRHMAEAAERFLYMPQPGTFRPDS